MKEIYIFSLLFTIINIYIYCYMHDINSCIDPDYKTYIILFYLCSLIYLVYMYINFDHFKNKDNYTSTIATPSLGNKTNSITIDLSNNPEYTSTSQKLIYWSSDFNVNGIVDIVDNKAIININNTSLKYRIIDINEKLSNVYNY
jgi:hypothetical protein